MKKILQEIFIYSLSLHITSISLDGLKISGGVSHYLLAGALLALGFKLLKPIILTIALPLQILTLGLLSPVVTVLLLFVLTKAVSFITVRPFTFPGFEILSIAIPSFSASLLLSFIILSVTISFIAGLIRFIVSK